MEFKLESGAKLTVTESSFEHAIALNDALIKAVGTLELNDDILNTDIDPKDPIQTFRGTSGVFSLFINKVTSVASSPVVRACIMACGGKAVYENVRVTPALFDDPRVGSQARKDYYAICSKIVEVNCLPFLADLLSVLKISRLINSGIPKQK